MNEETLFKMKEELKELKKEVSDYNKRVKRVRELEETAEVQEYRDLLGISDTIEKDNRDDDALIKSFYEKYSNTIEDADTSQIYVYYGAYKDEKDGRYDVKVRVKNEEEAEYKSYINIENTNRRDIPIEDCEKFELTHRIIHLKNYAFVSDYLRIKDDFFITAIKEDEVKAKRKILTKYNKNDK